MTESPLQNTKLYAIPIAVVALAVAAFGAAVLAENIDPLNNNSQYAWSENAGWLNAEPSNCTDCGVHVTETGLTGYIWGENIGWINLSCKNNNTCGGPAGNWGVTNNGSGVLSGRAWAENAGWISFSCQNNPASCAGTGNYGVTINGATGVFSGNAWGENIGWISFSDTTPVAYQVQAADEDGDGVYPGSDNCPNWPNAGQGQPVWPVPADDADCDGFSDSREQYMGTSATLQCPGTTTPNDEPDAWPTDFNDSRTTNLSDLVLMGDVYNLPTGTDPAKRRFDLNANGTVNLSDVVLMGPFYNRSCS